MWRDTLEPATSMWRGAFAVTRSALDLHRRTRVGLRLQAAAWRVWPGRTMHGRPWRIPTNAGRLPTAQPLAYAAGGVAPVALLPQPIWQLGLSCPGAAPQQPKAKHTFWTSGLGVGLSLSTVAYI